MPNLDDIIKQHTEPPRTLDGFLDWIPDDDRQKIDQLMADANWSHEAIANVIVDYSQGLVGSSSGVSRYRRKQFPALFTPGIETR